MLGAIKILHGLLHEDPQQTGDATIPGNETPDQTTEVEIEMTTVVALRAPRRHDAEDLDTETATVKAIVPQDIEVAAEATVAVAAGVHDGDARHMVRRAEKS